MKKYIPFLICSFFGFFILFPVFAQSPDLYVFIVTQESNELGTAVDKENMKNLMESIKQNVPSLNVHITYLDDTQASKASIQRKLRYADIDANDIVWFYYSGHGRNYDSWPQTDEEEVPLTWVHKQLKTTGARLTIAMYDCSNNMSLLADVPSDLNPKSTYYKFLFLEAKGNIISANSSSTQYGYGNPQSGSIFTNSFIDAIKTNANWEDVFLNAKRMTMENARERQKTQVPIYDIKVNTRQPVAAPLIKTKYFSSLSDMAEQLTWLIRENGKKETITVSDIKRWNPEVTERNFKTFKKGRFNPDEPSIRLYRGEGYSGNAKVNQKNQSNISIEEKNAYLSKVNEIISYPTLLSPIPQPNCFDKISLDSLIGQSKYDKKEIELNVIQSNLEKVLNECGYFQLKYFQLEKQEGFVLSVGLERYNKKTGKPKKPRFSKERNTVSLEQFTFKEYFEQLFYADPGHHRLILFTVSPYLELEQEKDKKKEDNLIKKTATGSHNLARIIGESTVNTQHFQCNVLVYEYTKEKKGDKLIRNNKNHLQGRQHLRASGIWQAITNLNKKQLTSK